MEQITREDIKRLRDVSHRQRDRAYLGAGSIIRGRYEALLDMAEAHLAEPARLAAARVEGVREGIEIAARYHEGKADVYRDNRAQFGFLHTSYAAEIRSLSPAPAEPSAPVAPEPVIKTIERVLDECSAWIARPSPDVTKRVAIAAGFAWQAAMDHEANRIPDLEERISALEAKNEKLREGLGTAAAQFEFYRDQHMAKGTAEGRQKAETNAQMAAMCRALLQGQGGAS